MYHYITDEKFLLEIKRKCSSIINQLVQKINNDDYLEVRASLVGSGKRNLITQNGKEPVDLDYNLFIIAWDSDLIDIDDCHKIKEYVRKKYNEVLRKNDWKDCDDSKSSLTTKKESLPGFNTKISIDLCIVQEDEENWYRLIHKKSGNTNYDEWYWNPGRSFENIKEKEKWIKSNNLWVEVKEVYLNKKNMYLTRNDYNHPSFVCYIEAINEVYNKN